MHTIKNNTQDMWWETKDIILDMSNKLDTVIEYIMIHPKIDQDILIRADVPQMLNNAGLWSRNNVVKVSYTDRKQEDTVNAQLIHCLGSTLMKTVQKWDALELYIQTSDPIVAVTSGIEDEKIQSFLDKKNKFSDERFVSLYDMDLLELLLANNPGDSFTVKNQIFDPNGLCIWPDIAALRQHKQMDSIRVDKDIYGLSADNYKSLMIYPGAYIFPIYQSKQHTINPKLIVHASGVVGW